MPGNDAQGVRLLLVAGDAGIDRARYLMSVMLVDTLAIPARRDVDQPVVPLYRLSR